jgi:hypothetical protein
VSNADSNEGVSDDAASALNKLKNALKQRGLS